MYDARIGRWLSIDPAGQFTSPYEGMGDNPVTGFDKTGGSDSTLMQKLPNGDLKAPDLKEVTITAKALTWYEIYKARFDRGEDPFEGPNGQVIQTEYNDYMLLYRPTTPDIEGIMLNGNIGVAYASIQLTMGLVRDNTTNKYHFFYGGALYGQASDVPIKSSIPQEKVGMGASFDYLTGYKTKSTVTFNNDFPGKSQNYDVTLFGANFGGSTPLDPNGNAADGYNTFYYGVGMGFNASVGGAAKTNIVK